MSTSRQGRPRGRSSRRSKRYCGPSLASSEGRRTPRSPFREGELELVIRRRDASALLTLVSLSRPSRVLARDVEVEVEALAAAALDAAAAFCRELAEFLPEEAEREGRRLRAAARALRRAEAGPSPRPSSGGSRGRAPRVARAKGGVTCALELADDEGHLLAYEGGRPDLGSLLVAGRLTLRGADGATLAVFPGIPFLALRDLGAGVDRLLAAIRRGEPRCEIALARPGRGGVTTLTLDLAEARLIGPDGPARCPPLELARAIRRGRPRARASRARAQPATGRERASRRPRGRRSGEARADRRARGRGSRPGRGRTRPRARPAPAPAVSAAARPRPAPPARVPAPLPARRGRAGGRRGSTCAAASSSPRVGLRWPRSSGRQGASCGAPPGQRTPPCCRVRCFWRAAGSSRRSRRAPDFGCGHGRSRARRRSRPLPSRAARSSSWGAGALTALDPGTGRTLWRLVPPGAGRLAATAFGGIVAAGADTGFVYGVDGTGRVVWRVRGRGPVVRPPAPVAGLALVLCAAETGAGVVALAIDPAGGARLWEAALDLVPSGPPIAWGRRIAVAGALAGDPIVATLEESGAPAWAVAPPLSGPPTIGAAGALLVARDPAGGLVALGRDGTSRWTRPASAGAPGPGAVPPAIARGTVIVAADGVTALDARTGEIMGAIAGVAPVRVAVDASLGLALLDADGLAPATASRRT